MSHRVFTETFAVVFLALASMSISADFSVVGRTVGHKPADPSRLAQADFGGTLRLYVVEPTARWIDASESAYHFGFIDFALDSMISLNNGDRIHLSRAWDGSGSGYDGFTEDNIMVQAVIFGDDAHQAYASPPSSYPFWAYYVEAAAAATPGTMDSNNSDGAFTHTVFLEEASSTACGYCPTMNYYLGSVYNLDTCDFIYTAMILENPKADAYLTLKYNLLGTPTAFVDGGGEVLFGGFAPETPYIDVINSCGARPTEGANVMVAVEWLGLGDLQIDVVCSFNAPLNATPTLAGPPLGATETAVNIARTYSAVATNTDNDAVYYRWDWGDGQSTDWLGPFNSGKICEAGHSWSSVGQYDVRAKTRDRWLAESDWTAPLTVTVGCCQLRGNVDGAGGVNVSDLTYLVAYLFSGCPTPPSCP